MKPETWGHFCERERQWIETDKGQRCEFCAINSATELEKQMEAILFRPETSWRDRSVT